MLITAHYPSLGEHYVDLCVLTLTEKHVCLLHSVRELYTMRNCCVGTISCPCELHPCLHVLVDKRLSDSSAQLSRISLYRNVKPLVCGDAYNPLLTISSPPVRTLHL